MPTLAAQHGGQLQRRLQRQLQGQRKQEGMAERVTRLAQGDYIVHNRVAVDVTGRDSVL